VPCGAMGSEMIRDGIGAHRFTPGSAINATHR